jgi:hypothetical protein
LNLSIPLSIDTIDVCKSTFPTQPHRGRRHI